MKKLLFLGIGFLFLLAIPATVFLIGQKQELRKKAAPASTMSLEPKSSTVKVGDIFTMEAILDTADNQIIATAVKVAFDATKLEAQSIANGPLFPNVINTGVVESGKASITVTAASTTTPVKGKGTAVTIRFKALSPTTTATQIAFTQETFANAMGEGENNALTSTAPATITITDSDGPPVSQTPSPTITQAPTPILSPTDEASPSAEPTETIESTLSPKPTQQTDASTGEVTGTPAPINEELSPTEEPIAQGPLQILSPNEKSVAVTTKPVIRGKAPPGSTVTITIYSTPITAVVMVDQNGNWVFTPDTPLEAGHHNIVVSSEDAATGETFNATGSFIIASGVGGASPDKPIPVAGSVETTMLLIALGIFLITTGIVLPRVIQ